VTAEAGSGAAVPDAAEAGGVASSVSGASESGVPEVSGTVLRSAALAEAGCALSGGGVCVRVAGGAGSGGTVGK
jgi:hypothetical protein